MSAIAQDGPMAVHLTTSVAVAAVPPEHRNVARSDIRAVSKRVADVGGINLGQGSCPLPPSQELIEAASNAMRSGYNSYTPYEGIAPLREALVQKYASHNRLPISRDDVLITSGATGALESICGTYLRPGDEVVVFEPVYQYHVGIVREHGATTRSVVLNPPHWTFSQADLEAAFTPHTKLVVFANPGNPTGRVYSQQELEWIAEACVHHGVLAVVDEVYEYLTYEGRRHISLAALPGMFERTFTICSAGKTFFVTGWRVGWLVGPSEAVKLIGIKADRTYVCAPAPLQHAVAAGLGFQEAFFARQRATLNKKRLQLSGALAQAGFVSCNPQGAYYILADCSRLGGTNDTVTAEHLLSRTGIGAVPGSAFRTDGSQTGMLRFCFAVDDSTLDDACERLRTIRM